MATKNIYYKYKSLIIALLIIVMLYLFLYSVMQQPLLSHNVYDNYTLQALAWWEGKATIDQDYSWLELAFYKDKIFSSFPPVPTITMFLLTPFFGEKTPNNLISTLYIISSFIILFLFCKRKNISDVESLFWSGFIVFGGNLIIVSLYGAVWLQSQCLSFFLTILSLYYITSSKKYQWYLAYVCWALAVGCRPFQIIYFPVYLVILWNNLKGIKPNMRLRDQLLNISSFLILPAIIGGVYAWYNYIRFENIFEFGHNYLPEFTGSEHGQFSIVYIAGNFRKIFRMPYYENSMLTFPRFNGFAFYIANPIFIVYFVRLFQQMYKKVFNISTMIFVLVIVHMVLYFSHKTMGGWQFGLRYFVDMFPFLFLSIYYTKMRVKTYEILLFAFGFMLNIYGALWLMLEWGQ